jgi:hypothetical protein
MKSLIFNDYAELKEMYPKAIEFIQSSEIPISILTGSHVCYRTDTREKFDSIVSSLQADTNMSYLSQVSSIGRRISWFKFKDTCIELGRDRFSYLQLIEPKEFNRYREGFTHFAYNLIEPKSIQIMIKEYPYLPWIRHNQHSNGNIELNFEDNYQIKFYDRTVQQMLQH